MGSIKIAHQGCQNHNPTLDEIKDRFFEAYGYRF
jgi:adenosine kinase